MAGSTRPPRPLHRRGRRAVSREHHGGCRICRLLANRGHGRRAARLIDGQQPDADVLELGRSHLLRRRFAACARLGRQENAALFELCGRSLQLQCARRTLGQDDAERRRYRDRRSLRRTLRASWTGGRADAAASAAGLAGPLSGQGGRHNRAGLVVGRRPLYGAPGLRPDDRDHGRSEISDRRRQGMATHSGAAVGRGRKAVPARRTVQGREPS